jgi:hypothetical protein
LCVIDDCFDFSAMADDALILKKTLDVAPGETRDSVEVEIMEAARKFSRLARMVRQLRPD